MKVGAGSGMRGRRTKIGAGVAGAVVVLALAGALVSHTHSHRSNVTVRPPATTAPPTSPATTAPPSTTVPRSTTTTGPIAALNANAYQATYLVGSSPITVSVSGRSWVEIRAGGPGGPVTFSGLMTAGQSQSVAAPAWVKIGNPASTAVTAAGRPVGLPNPASQQAFSLTFQ